MQHPADHRRAIRRFFYLGAPQIGARSLWLLLRLRTPEGGEISYKTASSLLVRLAAREMDSNG